MVNIKLIDLHRSDTDSTIELIFLGIDDEPFIVTYNSKIFEKNVNLWKNQYTKNLQK